MKCEKYGKEIKNLLPDTFRHNGRDELDAQPVIEFDGKDEVLIANTKKLKGCELEEIFKATICQHCKQLPFRTKKCQSVHFLYFDGEGAGK